MHKRTRLAATGIAVTAAALMSLLAGASTAAADTGPHHDDEYGGIGIPILDELAENLLGGLFGDHNDNGELD